MNFVTIEHTTINLNQIAAIVGTEAGEVIIKLSNRDICTFPNCNYNTVLAHLAMIEERVRRNSKHPAIEEAKKGFVAALSPTPRRSTPPRPKSIKDKNHIRPAG
jgi:hypothetical protein